MQMDYHLRGLWWANLALLGLLAFLITFGLGFQLAVASRVWDNSEIIQTNTEDKTLVRRKIVIILEFHTLVWRLPCYSVSTQHDTFLSPLLSPIRHGGPVNVSRIGNFENTKSKNSNEFQLYRYGVTETRWKCKVPVYKY